MKAIHIKVAYWIHKIEYIYLENENENEIKRYINELIYGEKNIKITYLIILTRNQLI